MGGKKYYHVLGGAFAENKGKYDSDIEDERKLFYVAVTRAKNNLFLSYTFEKQEVSCFVAEAAESSCLKIDKNDLYYEPPCAERSTRSIYKEQSSDYDDKRKQWEQERAERAQYKQLVAYVREALYEDYHVANHFCPGIILEFSDICKKGDEAILAKAREKGLI
jgi:ATP-dependent exoDNAse (exonuclease V) beta subunit